MMILNLSIHIWKPFILKTNICTSFKLKINLMNIYQHFIFYIVKYIRTWREYDLESLLDTFSYDAYSNGKRNKDLEKMNLGMDSSSKK